MICDFVAQDLNSFKSPDGGFNAWNITFTLNVSGVIKGQLNCQQFDTSLPAACLAAQGGPTWDNGDSVTVMYNSVNISADATGIEVRMCYSKSDMVDRPWRKAGADIKTNLNNQCKFKVAVVNSTAAGKVTWKLPSTTPNAALFPRIFTKCGEKYCGIGQTPAGNPFLL